MGALDLAESMVVSALADPESRPDTVVWLLGTVEDCLDDETTAEPVWDWLMGHAADTHAALVVMSKAGRRVIHVSRRLSHWKPTWERVRRTCLHEFPDREIGAWADGWCSRMDLREALERLCYTRSMELWRKTHNSEAA